jgi:hypothetical protein
MSQQSHGAYGSNRLHVQKFAVVEMETPTVIPKAIVTHGLGFYTDLNIPTDINIYTI